MHPDASQALTCMHHACMIPGKRSYHLVSLKKQRQTGNECTHVMAASGMMAETDGRSPRYKPRLPSCCMMRRNVLDTFLYWPLVSAVSRVLTTCSRNMRSADNYSTPC